MQRVQDRREGLRSARELCDPVLHEAIADDEAQGKRPPFSSQRSDRTAAELEEGLHTRPSTLVQAQVLQHGAAVAAHPVARFVISPSTALQCAAGPGA